MLISICGLQGSGKSTLSRKLQEKINNSICIDIDKISHSIYDNKDCYNEVINTFKDVTTNNKIDRNKLGKIVFNSKEEMEKLTRCTWKYMEKEIDSIIENNKDKVIILEWLLLNNTKYLKLSDLRILIEEKESIRKERVLKRDNISEEKFYIRDKSAIPYKKEDFNCIINTVDNDTIERIIKLI